MSHDATTRLDGIIGRVLGNAGLTDQMTIGTDTIEGYFERRWVEQGAGDDRVGGWIQTFDCRAEDVPAGLAQGDEVTVENEGTMIYQRREPNGTGRVLLFLGSSLS